MINFKASLNSTGTIQKIDKNNNFSNIPVAFVELDINSTKDLNVLKKVSKYWEKGDIYARDVYERFRANQEQKVENPDERFFALTRQSGDFEHLKYNQILGVAEIYLPIGEPPEIEFLQTRPKFLTKKTKIKHVGKVIVDKIKQILAGKTIELYSTYDAIPFYEKQGFKVIEGNLMKLIR